MYRALTLIALACCSCSEREPNSGSRSDEPRNPPESQFWADEEKLASMLVGQWRKDENYYYGRFIGEVTFSEDGRCARSFAVYKNDGVTLQPLSIERGRWSVESGYILFTDTIGEGLEPGEEDYKVPTKSPDQREWVMQLNAEELMTVDERNKIDAYKRLRKETPDN